MIRRGLSEKIGKRLTTATERRVRAEVLVRRVAHFTRGVMFGSREFANAWFEANRDVVKVRSRSERNRSWWRKGGPSLVFLREEFPFFAEDCCSLLALRP